MATHEQVFAYGDQGNVRIERYGQGYAKLIINKGRGKEKELIFSPSHIEHHIKECEEMLASIKGGE